MIKSRNGEIIGTQCLTMSVPEAGKAYLGIGRDASYEAAHRGQIPYMQVGKLMRVPIAAMERMMEEVGSTTSNGDE